MPAASSTIAPEPVRLRYILSLILLSSLAFHLAHAVPRLSFLVLAYLYGAVRIAQLPTSRQAFYSGFFLGFLAFGPQLFFFFHLFGFGSVPLWAVLALWEGLFCLLAWQVRFHLGLRNSLILLPFIWTGLEYFRSELYYLKFSWLIPGYLFSSSLPAIPMAYIGVYGAGFVLVAVAALLTALPSKSRLFLGLACGGLLLLPATYAAQSVPAPGKGKLIVAGLQMEFPGDTELKLLLDKLAVAHADAQLIVLSEYTFDGPVPNWLLRWCLEQRRFLIVGGKEPTGSGAFRNTVFVVNPAGEIVFEQGKSVPIQFFNDGLPAKTQRVWESPWGKIGLCICYDLSYTRVTDALVRMGAQALIVPTMDIQEWGPYQHNLHARVPPIRAAEYGVPIFRLASSGISQAIDSDGRVLASTRFAEDGAVLLQALEMKQPGKLPFDRKLAPFCVGLSALLIVLIAFLTLKNRRSRLRTMSDSTPVQSDSLKQNQPLRSANSWLDAWLHPWLQSLS
ncbi:MAG TPA: nitrilase-related carbon-nitrogen hydrolase [Verrucomicrobiae bacterium]|jgi:apolipoprotein N-acyltransferase